MRTHDKPAPFHSSPQEAMQAPAEEFLYVAGRKLRATTA
jgi:hypothetical protein